MLDTVISVALVIIGFACPFAWIFSGAYVPMYIPITLFQSNILLFSFLFSFFPLFSFIPSQNKVAKTFGFIGIALYSLLSLGIVLSIMLYLIVFVPWFNLVPQAH